jgi:hypothetical protein
MPIYIEDRENPGQIHFEEKSLGWVYFEQNLVWQKEEILFSFKTFCGIQEEWAELVAHGEGGITPWKWNLGDGTILKSFDVTHNYSDNTEKEVKIYVPRNPQISVDEIKITCYSITEIDLSKIKSFNKLYLFLCDLHYFGDEDTSIVFPETIDGSVGFIDIFQLNTEVLDFSNITTMEATTAWYWEYIEMVDVCGYHIMPNCQKLNQIIFPSSVIENVNYLGFEFLELSIIESLDLSSFNLADKTYLEVSYAPYLSELIMPSLSVTGTIGHIYLEGLPSLFGILDLSWILRGSSTPYPGGGREYTLGFNLRISELPNITSIIFPSIFSGEVESLTISNIGIETLDLSMFLEFIDIFEIYITNNSLLSDIIFPQKEDIITPGKIKSITIANNDSLEEIDLHWIPGVSSLYTPSIQVSLNENLETITFPDSLVDGVFYNISLSNNNLSSINIYNVPSYIVRVYDNENLSSLIIPISDCYQLAASKCNLHTLDFTNLVINKNQAYVDIGNNGLLAAEVNKMLYDIDTLATSGYTSRFVSFIGTNAAPDSSSGGYNGTAAKASLQSKGFTVYTN